MRIGVALIGARAIRGTNRVYWGRCRHFWKLTESSWQRRTSWVDTYFSIEIQSIRTPCEAFSFSAPCESSGQHRTVGKTPCLFLRKDPRHPRDRCRSENRLARPARLASRHWNRARAHGQTAVAKLREPQDSGRVRAR